MRTSSRLIPIAACAAVAAVLAGCTINRTLAVETAPAPAVATVPAVVTTPAPTVITPAPTVITPAPVIVR